MTLKDFVTQFLDHNAMFRVLIKCTPEQEGNHMVVADDWDTVDMCHAISKGYSKFNNYADVKVVHVVSVDTRGHYPDAINIVVEGDQRGNLITNEECDRLLFEYRHGGKQPTESL